MNTRDFATYLSTLPSRHTGSMGSAGVNVYVNSYMLPSEAFSSNYQYTESVEVDAEKNEKFALANLRPGVAVVIEEYDYFRSPPEEVFTLFYFKKGEWHKK